MISRSSRMPYTIRRDETYDLHLKVKLENNFAVRLGGNISTSNSNQIYLGLSYQDLNYYAKEFLLTVNSGKSIIMRNSWLRSTFLLRSRPLTALSHLLLLSTILRKDKLFSRNDKPAFNQKDERFLKLQVGLPFLLSKRAEFGIGIARIEDKYFQRNIIDFEKDRFDRSRYDLFGGSISFNGSTLNSRQYRHKATKKLLLHRYSWDGKDSIPVKRPKEFK